MGKSLIIKDANFGTNGIAAEFSRLNWIGASVNNKLSGATNGQYIASGLKTSIDTRMVIEFQTSSSAYSVILSGCYVGNTSNIRPWVQADKVVVLFGVSINESPWTMATCTINRNLWDGNTHIIDISKTGVVLDGTSYTYDASPIYVEQQPIYLDCCSKNPSGTEINTAARNTISGVDTPLNGVIRYKRIKLYSDYANQNSLALDVVPVKRLSDETICFFDIVSSTYKIRNDGSTPDNG